MYYENCPACGAKLMEDARYCSQCGTKVPNPPPPKKHRVFTGTEHVLILSETGKLYGWGNNRRGQIADDNQHEIFSEPHLMAEDVISAAAGENYSLYVTRDGQVHLLGYGRYADRFPGFSGAAEVYASLLDEHFWIVDRAGNIFYFGDNKDGEYAYLDEQMVKEWTDEADQQSRIVSYIDWELQSTVGWISHEYKNDDKPSLYQFSSRIEETEFYRNLAKAHGKENLSLEFTYETESEEIVRKEDQCPEGWSTKERWGYYGHNSIVTDIQEWNWIGTFSAKLYLSKREIYTPEPYRIQTLAKLPVWFGCEPRDWAHQQTYLRLKRLYPGLCKLVITHHFWTELRTAALLEDGRLLLLDEEDKLPEIKMKPDAEELRDVSDVSFAHNHCAVSYSTGKIRIIHRWYLPECDSQKYITILTLPEDV